MRIILLIALSISFYISKAQNKPLNILPAGKYETSFRNSQGNWDRGDIILLDEKSYKISTSDEIGEYRFSATAQRIFFITGPLKKYYARTSETNNEPAIFLPINENEHLGLKLSNEVWCYYHK